MQEFKDMAAEKSGSTMTKPSEPASVEAETASKNSGADDSTAAMTRTNHDGRLVDYTDCEVVIGLVGAMGADQQYAVEKLTDRLKTAFGYNTEEIRISQTIQELASVQSEFASEYDRSTSLIDAGNTLCQVAGNSALALAVITLINARRDVDERSELKGKARHAYIVRTLKRPEEVSVLREVYGSGFFLIGVYSSPERRKENLLKRKLMTEEQANALMLRDADEHLPYGQQTSDTFHLADCFLDIDNHDHFEHDLWRVLDIIFGDPHRSPTFEEYAMFLAFAASLRSADLSRQVGAVIAREREIVATGANDCPCARGGLYWPERDSDSREISDIEDGRDHTRGYDSNDREKQRIIEEIAKKIEGKVAGIDGAKSVMAECNVREILASSSLDDITEYGRVVHAEMEALLSCARNSVSTRGCDLYCTTFPCHNCAKHIVAAGIAKVFYIEPYAKSKAVEFHRDSITTASGGAPKVEFLPFVGIGPRRFVDLFSMRSGSGYPLRRKERDGTKKEWSPAKDGRLRTQLLPFSYIDLESIASKEYSRKGLGNGKGTAE